MQRTDHIKTSFERNAKAIALRPSVGQGTAKTRVTLREGLTCDVQDGAWKLVVDASQKSGGDGSAPDPGVYGRTALGSCLAIGYGMWAAKLGVAFTSLQVEVQADYDGGGMYGVTDAKPGYRQVRVIVTVESDASEDDVRQVIAEADAHSPYLDVFTRAIDVRKDLTIVSLKSQV
ncbi:MAG: OsmC family protein [Acidobacteria bacterium]|nr:OsmC family protein [Acidobacteriota bacterium]